MPVDYSKWDALELSDDSDIEVHPNVDKRSFIRAKQNQIHQERDRRRHQITTLKYERIINDGLLTRIDRLLSALKSHSSEKSKESVDEIVFQSLIESAGDPDEDKPPMPPPGVHENAEQPTYSKMMACLVDQVKKAIDESKTGDRFGAFRKEIGEHQKKVQDLQKQLHVKLAELEKEDKKFITSDDIHTGFDYSNVAKQQALAKNAEATSKNSEVELLNPTRPTATRTDTGQSAGADADVEEGNALDGDEDLDVNDDESIRATKLGKDFGKIPIGDYRACLQFISANPSVLAERETDGLLVEAFNAEMDGKHKFARQCVHQGLLLQYCRQLGRDGVALFFKRITTKNHQAQKLFEDDVKDTYNRIRTRAAELVTEKKDKPEEAEGVEQIQLHAVDPNTTINIQVPPATSDDPEVQNSRKIFEAFPPGLQRALESGKLDEVNKVLGKMSVDEAEQVVEKLGEGGMLSLEEGVIDATTEEGRKQMEAIERTGKMPGDEGESGDRVVELEEEPPHEEEENLVDGVD